jgi:PAS domain S-box-containing protein
MNLFRDLPLKRKLTIISMVTSGVALALTCAAFIAYEQFTFRRDMARDLAITAEMIGFNTASALSFEDTDSATETLKGLSAHPQIIRSCVYDKTGKVFATYRWNSQVNRPWPDPKETSTMLGENSLELFHTIRLAGEMNGTIYLESDLQELHERWWSYILIALVVMAAAMLVTWLLIRRLQRVISEPIAQLASIAGAVGAEKNYALRAIKSGDDEIGRLIDGFNNMLVQIQARDADLLLAHQNLERRVEERTRSLDQARLDVIREKERFQFIFDFVPVGISLQSAQSGVWTGRLINNAHLRICGLTQEQLEPGIFERITIPEDYERQRPLMEQLQRGEIDNYSIEKRYVRLDGSVVWVVFSARRKEYPDGRAETLSTVVDITDLKNAQEASALEHARFKFIFDSNPVGISLHSEHGHSTRYLINDAHLRICGLTREHMADEHIFAKISHPEDYEQQVRLQQQLLRGEIDHFTMEKRYLRMDGRTVWVVFSARRNAYSAGRVETLVTIVDITDLKRAQEETVRERARLQFIFDSVPVGIALQTRQNGQWTRLFNSAHLRICGLTTEQINEPYIFEKISHPEDYKRQQVLAAQLNQGEIDRFSIEKRFILPGGRIVWVVLTFQRKDYPDGRTEHLSTLVDITDLKEAQEAISKERERLQFIFDSLPVGIAWRMYGRRETSIINAALARITGVPVEECQIPERYVEVSHPDDQAMHDQLKARFRAGEIDHYSIEKRYRRPDGTWTWGLLSARILLPDKSDEVQEITTLVDITERKQTEVELEETHRQLLETSRRAGMAEVATGVLHNVGNVLNSVNVSATLVADQVRRSKGPNVGKVRDLLNQHRADLAHFLTEDPKGRLIPDYLATLAEGLDKEQAAIVAELESLRKNIDHIKDIVAMQQNYAKTSGVVETVSVPDLIEDALRMNAGSLARHDVDIAREYHARPVITLEKNKALQILVNLVRNAKYACDESGRVDKMLTIRTTADEQRVRIEVIDNGVGIPRENLTRIFAHGFTTRKTGHGFGLHSGALAAKEMGGALTVHSDGPGTGATFILDLPFKPEPKR